jgi:hypothetical protein
VTDSLRLDEAPVPLPELVVRPGTFDGAGNQRAPAVFSKSISISSQIRSERQSSNPRDPHRLPSTRMGTESIVKWTPL